MVASDRTKRLFLSDSERNHCVEIEQQGHSVPTLRIERLSDWKGVDPLPSPRGQRNVPLKTNASSSRT
jgi:hypothetical protein